MMATLSINIKRMKEWYKEKKILQKTKINLKTIDQISNIENSEDQDDSASLHTIGEFGNFVQKVTLLVDIVKVEALARQKNPKRHFLELLEIPSMRLL